MPDPDLDEVDRKIKEAKELAKEVRTPGVESGVVDPPKPDGEATDGDSGTDTDRSPS